MQAMPHLRSPSTPPCLLNIQPSPHCSDSQNNKTTTLHNPLTLYSKRARCHKSLNSLSLSLSLTVTATVTLSPPSFPQLPLFLSNQITWFAI